MCLHFSIYVYSCCLVLLLLLLLLLPPQPQPLLLLLTDTLWLTLSDIWHKCNLSMNCNGHCFIFSLSVLFCRYPADVSRAKPSVSTWPPPDHWPPRGRGRGILRGRGSSPSGRGCDFRSPLHRPCVRHRHRFTPARTFPSSFFPPNSPVPPFSFIPPNSPVLPSSFVPPSSPMPPSSFVPPNSPVPPSSFISPNSPMPPSSFVQLNSPVPPVPCIFPPQRHPSFPPPPALAPPRFIAPPVSSQDMVSTRPTQLPPRFIGFPPPDGVLQPDTSIPPPPLSQDSAVSCPTSSAPPQPWTFGTLPPFPPPFPPPPSSGALSNCWSRLPPLPFPPPPSWNWFSLMLLSVANRESFQLFFSRTVSMSQWVCVNQWRPSSVRLMLSHCQNYLVMWQTNWCNCFMNLDAVDIC